MPDIDAAVKHLKYCRKNHIKNFIIYQSYNLNFSLIWLTLIIGIMTKYVNYFITRKLFIVQTFTIQFIYMVTSPLLKLFNTDIPGIAKC